MTGNSTLVQVLDPAGKVVASSFPPHGLAEDDRYRIWRVGVRTPTGPRTVVVAQSLVPVQDNTAALTRTLATGMPALVLTVGLATFFFVGRSLRPVEAIRRQVASITAQDLHARV